MNTDRKEICFEDGRWIELAHGGGLCVLVSEDGLVALSL
jgi:hypothetical protein